MITTVIMMIDDHDHCDLAKFQLKFCCQLDLRAWCGDGDNDRNHGDDKSDCAGGKVDYVVVGGDDDDEDEDATADPGNRV